MMNDLKCNVCGQRLDAPLYQSPSSRSLDSLCQVSTEGISVYACRACAHLQNIEMKDVAAYYDRGYNILVESDEDDQVYEVQNGKVVYRTAHQLAVLLSKIALPVGARLLDYGCAKSSTIKALAVTRPDVEPHLFDVSERYLPFWEKFVRPENWATYQPRAEWQDRFDLVTSFFSFEHITHPIDVIRGIASLLKPGGRFYAIVPNVMTNVADFLVVDHVNHFTQSSLQHLLAVAGLELKEIDDTAHRGAFVIVAERSPSVAINSKQDFSDQVAETLLGLSKIAEFWKQTTRRVQAFEATLAVDAELAIYGAGFYGAFIAANLRRPDRATCYLDQNPFLQGKSFNGKPVFFPADLPPDINTLMVGLNPAHATRIIADIPVLAARELAYFFL